MKPYSVIRVVTHRSSPVTAAHSSSAFLSLCYWEPITCMYLLAARQSYFLSHLPPKTRFPEYGSLLLIGQFEERNAELEWAAVSWEDRCVTTLKTVAKETMLEMFWLANLKKKLRSKMADSRWPAFWNVFYNLSSALMGVMIDSCLSLK